MPGAMRCLRSSALLGRMILTRRTSMQHPEPKVWGRPDPNQPATQQLRQGLAMAQSCVCVPEDPFSRPTNRQFFGNACSDNWAAVWARQHLSAKNTLTAGDARIVEEQ